VVILPPTIPPTLPVTVPITPKLVKEPEYKWLFLLLLLLLCCCRRRWILCPVGKDEDDEEEDLEQSPHPTVMRSLPADGDDGIEVVPDTENPDFDGDYNGPNANRMAMKSTAASEIDEGGGVRYYRVVQEPEYEEPPPPPEPKVIDQYDKGLPKGAGMKLNHIEKEGPPPPEEDPHALEHFEPDGGIVEHQRKGKWGYDADGGYTEEQRATKEGSEWNRPGYDRAAEVVPTSRDDRRDRNLAKYGGGAIFDHLDDADEAPIGGGKGNSLEWVFTETLNTLDNNEDDLRSEASTSQR